MDSELQHLKREAQQADLAAKDHYIRALERALGGPPPPNPNPNTWIMDERLICQFCWQQGSIVPAAAVAPRGHEYFTDRIHEEVVRVPYARYVLCCEDHFRHWYDSVEPGTELPYFLIAPGPQEDCTDPHRRCATIETAAEGPCPIHSDGLINLDCDCADCSALDCYPTWYPA